MIDKIGGMFSLICDVCGNEAGVLFDDFYDAVAYKKEEGWKSQKCNSDWEDVCPECQEAKA